MAIASGGLGVIDRDSLLPNNQVIRVFPRRTGWTPTDEMAFVGAPPLIRPGDKLTPVRVSVTFTWDRAWAENIAAMWRVHYRDVKVGGPAYDDPAGEFIPGRYLKEGCTITSRGCPKKCGWCKVPFSEGVLRYLQIKDGWLVQDNNLLACSREHFEQVFTMLRRQDKRIFFNGGLDKDFAKPWHKEFFDSIPVGEMWFACDTNKDAALERLAKAREIFSDYSINKMRCYTMIGYDDETLEEAEQRIEKVYALGFLPFSQLYQPPTADRPTKIYSADWKAVNRKWSRPAIYRSKAEMPAPGLFDAVATQDANAEVRETGGEPREPS